VQFCNEAKTCAHWLVNETLWYETETFDFQSETRSRPRPSHISTRPRRLETTVSRPRRRDRDYIPGSCTWHLYACVIWLPLLFWHCHVFDCFLCHFASERELHSEPL